MYCGSLVRSIIQSYIACRQFKFQRLTFFIHTAQFQFREVTENEVFNLLSNIATNKATGLDKIPAKLVKISAPFITKHLSIIFNQSLSQGTFPYDWKISKVTPIYKKGPKHDMNNYRPISVISTIAKVMEKIAHNQLYLYLQNENILLCLHGQGLGGEPRWRTVYAK